MSKKTIEKVEKKVQKSPKANTNKKSKKGETVNQQGDYPVCINQKQARMVCLNENCEDYPFFCSTCQDESCEKEHQHEDKLVTIGYKQFARRTLNDRKPTQKLDETITSYKEVLEKLRQDVNEFVEKELEHLDEIYKKSTQLANQDNEIITKLKEHQYEGITGAQLDQIWSNLAETEEKVDSENEIAQFIQIKEEEVKGISEHFQHLNKMELDKLDADQEQDQEDNTNGKKSYVKKNTTQNSNVKEKQTPTTAKNTVKK